MLIGQEVKKVLRTMGISMGDVAEVHDMTKKT
jgi:hypothetical protein